MLTDGKVPSPSADVGHLTWGYSVRRHTNTTTFWSLRLSMFSHAGSVDVQLVVTPRMLEVFLRSGIAFLESGCPSGTDMFGAVGVSFRLSEARRRHGTHQQCQ